MTEDSLTVTEEAELQAEIVQAVGELETCLIRLAAVEVRLDSKILQLADN